MSVGLHGGLFTLALFTSLVDRSPMEFVTYEIEMVSPPPAVQAEVQPVMEDFVVADLPAGDAYFEEFAGYAIANADFEDSYLK